MHREAPEVDSTQAFSFIKQSFIIWGTNYGGKNDNKLWFNNMSVAIYILFFKDLAQLMIC